MNLTDLTIADISTALAARVELITVDASLEESVSQLRWLMDIQTMCKDRIAEAKALMVTAMEARGAKVVTKKGPVFKPAEIRIGTTRYYVGYETEVKPASIEAVAYALLEKGKAPMLIRCIAANGIKHGQVEKELEDKKQFDDLFVFKKKGELKLQVVDERFIPGRQGNDERNGE